jgi:phosphoglucomutase
MSQSLSPLAGKPAPASILVDVDALVSAYYALAPDPNVPAQRVAFGTSGHRGCSLERAFNERHILAITRAICEHRKRAGIDGPLFLGADSHALSSPALASALEVLAAEGVTTFVSRDDELVPTPALSRAILVHNLAHPDRLADGIIVTPSHNPPESGGFKYNPPSGGPADTATTAWIEARANELLATDVHRLPIAEARRASSTLRHDFLDAYVGELERVVDLTRIRDAGLRIGVDPLGGAGVHYWPRIAERYRLELESVRGDIDPRFAFMTVDHDGKIRTDPSSTYAMQNLIALRDRFDIAFGCDADHDRHGIVTRSAGLLEPNHYLAVLFDYLMRERRWPTRARIGKTVVTTALVDRVAARLGRGLHEVPVGFKWFVDGLRDGTIGCCGEESAGASLLCRDGSVWTTDKDGIVAALLAAEITAGGADPAQRYQQLTEALGRPLGKRIDVAAGQEQRRRLGRLSRADVHGEQLAGDPIEAVLERAPGNDAPIGGIKVTTRNGWFAARPSGTEPIYKVYAESFAGEEHLERLLSEAQRLVDAAIG